MNTYMFNIYVDMKEQNMLLFMWYMILRKGHQSVCHLAFVVSNYVFETTMMRVN